MILRYLREVNNRKTLLAVPTFRPYNGAKKVEEILHSVLTSLPFDHHDPHHLPS